MTDKDLERKIKNDIRKERNQFGVPLENKGAGTAGSHWQKKFMNTDYMTGDVYGETLISPITLALFIDSGWYQADYEKANLFNWGKNQGCSFLNKTEKCIETDRNKTIINKFENSYCSNLDKPVCSNLNIFRGNCKTKIWEKLPKYENYFNDPFRAGISNLMDKCPIAIEDSNGFRQNGGSCRIGADPKNSFEKVCPTCACFLSSLKQIKTVNRLQKKQNLKVENSLKLNLENKANQDSDYEAMCFNFICKSGIIYVKINEIEMSCPDFQTISVNGFTGNIKCPDSKVLCDKKYFWKFGSIN